MSLIKILNFKIHGDKKGSLVSLESFKLIPFEIRRAYYIFDTKQGVARGFHAHKSLKQIAVCVIGKCRMIFDDGKLREEAWLDSPIKAMLIDPMIWHEMHDFSEDCVLLVLASEHYDESDYIRDYDEFLKIVKR